jgi:hypothetical protein
LVTWSVEAADEVTYPVTVVEEVDDIVIRFTSFLFKIFSFTLF